MCLVLLIGKAHAVEAGETEDVGKQVPHQKRAAREVETGVRNRLMGSRCLPLGRVFFQEERLPLFGPANGKEWQVLGLGPLMTKCQPGLT
jgi:hypothetical protein